VTNIYSGTLATPVPLDPKNDVLAARPVFRFRLAPEAGEFGITIRRGAVNGTTVYSRHHLAPPRQTIKFDNQTFDDVCIWSLPHCVGEVLPTGEVLSNDTYYWVIRAYSPAKTAGSDESSAMSFSISPISTELTVDPYGARTPVTCSLWSNRAMTGTPVARSATTIRGMAPGLYYLSVFCDADADYARDSTEQWGYHRLINDPVRPFEPAAILVRPGVPQTIHVYMMGP